MVWCVVHFVLDNTVEVVPGSWYEKGNCAWPKSSKIKDMKKAIFHQVRPNKQDFSFFEARCLCSNIDSFSKAQKKCEMAKGKSDLSSTEEDKFKKKNIRRQNRVCISLQSGDSEQSDTSDLNKNSILCYHSTDSDSSPTKDIVADNRNTNFLRQDIDFERRPDGWSPLKVSKRDNIVPDKMSPAAKFSDDIATSSKAQTHIYNVTPLKTMNKLTPKMLISGNKSDNGSVIMSPLKTSKYTSSSQSHGVKRSLFDNVNNSPKLHKSDSSLTACTSNNSIINDNNFKKSVLHQLLTMKYEMLTINEKLNTIMKLLEDEKKIVSDTEYYEVSQFDKNFPINTYEELIEVETKISKDKTYHTNLVKRLSSVGGKTIPIMVKRIMSLVFNPKLLTTFSYNGRGNKKRSFVGLLINKMIFESVFKIKKFAASDNSTNEIEQVLKYVLIQTPFKLKKLGQTAIIVEKSSIAIT